MARAALPSDAAGRTSATAAAAGWFARVAAAGFDWPVAASGALGCGCSTALLLQRIPLSLPLRHVHETKIIAKHGTYTSNESRFVASHGLPSYKLCYLRLDSSIRRPKNTADCFHPNQPSNMARCATMIIMVCNDQVNPLSGVLIGLDTSGISEILMLHMNVAIILFAASSLDVLFLPTI